jgi:hypothetical protein
MPQTLKLNNKKIEKISLESILPNFFLCKRRFFLPFSVKLRAVLTHRQGRHFPRAPDFLGPPNSIMCLKMYMRKVPQKEKFYVVNDLDKNSFNSQENKC